MPFDNLPYADLMEKHGFIPANHAEPTFFPVEALRVFDEKGNELPGYKRIVRMDTGTTLNVATDSYQIITNEEAFGGFEAALRESSLDLTDMRIGTDYSAGGARCFRQYMLPAHRAVVGKSDVALRLIMMNSYDGSLAFRGQSGFYNFVCANTSVSGTDLSSFRMTHSGSIDVPKAIAGLTKAAEGHLLEAQRMQAWPQIGVSDTRAREVFEHMPQATKMLVDHLVHAWLRARDEDPVQGGANAWCLFNVLTAWSTHGEVKAAGGRGQIRHDREQRVRKLLEHKVWHELVAA
jgi:hypothetical protein